MLENVMASENRDNDSQQTSPNLVQVVFSVLAAAIGVQNSKNRERDFTTGNPLVFIIVGLLFTVLFVLTLVGVVYLVV